MWIKILAVITALSPLSDLFSEANSQILIRDVSWLVGIYSKSSVKPTLSFYHCQGVALHYKVILAPSTCLDRSISDTNYVIRVFDWAIDQKSTNASNYKDVEILKIFRHPLINDDHFKSTSLDLLFILVKKSLSFALSYYSLDGQNTIDSANYDNCVLVHLENKNKGVLIKQFRASVPDNTCKNKLIKGISNDNLNSFLCVKTNKYFCSDYKGGTLFCESQTTPEKYILTGLLAVRDSCYSLNIKIKQQMPLLLDYLYVVDKYWRKNEFDNIPSPGELSLELKE